jgi:hypothetical protein
MSALVKLRILDYFGYIVVRDPLLGLLPKDAAESVRKLDTERGKRRVDRERDRK